MLLTTLLCSFLNYLSFFHRLLTEYEQTFLFDWHLRKGDNQENQANTHPPLLGVSFRKSGNQFKRMTPDDTGRKILFSLDFTNTVPV